MSFSMPKIRVGEIRPSQLLRNFGVGAVVDLPNLSVMVMGLDDWEAHYQRPQEIGEERLRRAVQQWLGAQVAQLRTPPVAMDGEDRSRFTASVVGAPVVTFPRWMVCPYCHLLAPVESGLFQLKTESRRPDRARYVHTNCTKVGRPVPVLPARFLMTCEHGHLDDFPWLYFVHKGALECPGRLTLNERGFSSDITDVSVQCELCGMRRTMADAFGETGRTALPQCRGRRPHLRDFEDAGCHEQGKTLLLGASNSWFPVMIAALSIPGGADPLGNHINHYWLQLEKAESVQNITLMRSLGLFPSLKDVSDADIWSAIERKRNGATPTEEQAKDLKGPEWRVLSQQTDILDDAEFRLRMTSAPSGFEGYFERTALVERLREVNALIGFTRLAALDDLADGGADIELSADRLVPLTRRSPTWVPAFEVRGEGIFLRFREDALAEWVANHPALDARRQAFFQAHYYWRQRRHMQEPGGYYPGLRYVLLHSFAHALMRELALEAGYSMASLSERIYSRNPEDDGGPMAGVLIYTAAPDSEGTLGGLVSLGAPQRLGRHIHAALENIRWCASDPLCAGHLPRHDADELHGAACHACLFAPETSCERGNRYLDRSLLTPTIDHSDLSFFAE